MEKSWRLQGLDVGLPRLICNEQHRFLAAEQLRQLGMEQASILLEPVGRNTAPAIALAALQAVQEAEDPLLLVLAADHLIQDVEAFHASIRAALPLAADGKLVTFGIVPPHPETGYGYIEQGAAVGTGGYAVSRFVEKPDLATARDYLASGNYFWRRARPGHPQHLRARRQPSGGHRGCRGSGDRRDQGRRAGGA